MAYHSGQLDTSVEIVTPENIAFRYQVAGPLRRLPAYLIDLAIRIAVGLIALWVCMFLFALVQMPGLGLGAVLVFWFLLAWFYGGLFETFWNGQTPGKRVMQIRVLAVDGQPINGLQAVLRNLLRAIDAQPGLFYLVGLATAMTNDRFQRLGDLACGTMVVVEEKDWLHGALRVDEPLDQQARRLAGQVPADFRPGRTLALALARYVQRRRFFPLERRLEIARHLGEPLRDRFALPQETDPDELLLAVYHRTFVTDRMEEEPSGAGNPFLETGDSPFREEPALPMDRLARPLAAGQRPAQVPGLNNDSSVNQQPSFSEAHP